MGCDTVELFSILVGHRACAIVGYAAWLTRPLCRFCCRCVAWEGLSSQSDRSHGAGNSETQENQNFEILHRYEAKGFADQRVSWRALGRSFHGWPGGLRTSVT